ncbi:Triglyceride lipase-cholesterol esterase [Schizosaccharomyces pombe]
MIQLPFIQRLKWEEYMALFLGFFFVIFEKLLSCLAFVIHNTLGLFYRSVVRNEIKKRSKKRSRSRSVSLQRAKAIHDAADIREMCKISGYYVEDHLVRTEDDYILCIHRISKDSPGRIGSPHPKKLPVVYCHHGLLMNSEVWVCNVDPRNCLVFDLVNKGYDVWLGNNRGNKYSRQHLRFDSTDKEFWDFSIDDFAQYDIPDTIDYILKTSGQTKLTYIGFSQGTAQAFASLSIHPLLNDKINSLIALAPAISPKGLHNRVVDAFVKARPSILFFLFGRKSILPSAGFWQSFLAPKFFDAVLAYCLSQLFNWSCQNISSYQRLVSFAHLYSYTSVKCLVHWFQIMRSAEFRMYDNDQLGHDYFLKYYKAAKFPTNNIRTPIYLIWGGSDSLVDIQAMLNALPAEVEHVKVDSYEHLDMIWADTVKDYVIPPVLRRLRDIHHPPEHEENDKENREIQKNHIAPRNKPI